MGVLMNNFVHADKEAVITFSGLYRPQLLHIRIKIFPCAIWNLIIVCDKERTWWAHPVQRLIGTAIGMDKHRTVILHHK